MPVLPKIPPYVAEILQRLEDAGHRAFAVGGCVRDSLLGRTPRDWDVATDARTGEVAALFARTAPTGVKYGTVTVLTDGGNVEVTTFRTDGAYLDGRRPENVGFGACLEEDLLRRDFTVNALAMDREGRVTDIIGGLEDLRRGVIRCVGDPRRRFAEDALRMFRGVRFSARLGFAIEPETLSAIRELAPLAGRLSAGRVREELAKTLASDRPWYVRDLLDWGLLDAFPVEKRENVPFERLSAAPEELRLPVFALLAAPENPGELLRAFRCPSRMARDADEAPKLRGDALSVRLALSARRTEPVLIAAAAGGFYALAAKEARAGRFVRVPDLAIDGRDLANAGLAGPAIGRTLRALALRVTAGEVENDRGALLSAAAQGRGCQGG